MKAFAISTLKEILAGYRPAYKNEDLLAFYMVTGEVAKYVGLLIEEKSFSAIGTYWEKGNQNEIDIVAVNDLNKSVIFGEVKPKKENISIPGLKDKAKHLQAQLREYDAGFVGLSLTDM